MHEGQAGIELGSQEVGLGGGGRRELLQEAFHPLLDQLLVTRGN
jgi:hypothetical protein